MGGMEVGSVWGHGSYVAPDWTADWLHREAVFILDRWANAEFGSDFEQLGEEHQAQLSRPVVASWSEPTPTIRRPATITIDPIRAAAFQANFEHYSDVFTQRPRPNMRFRLVRRFGYSSGCTNFHRSSFWTSWAASTNRPGDHITYTNNWPYEPLVGNRATGEAVVWTGVSIIMLLAGISGNGMVVCLAAQRRGRAGCAGSRPAGSLGSDTPSQRATVKYFLGGIGVDPGPDACWASSQRTTVSRAMAFYGFPAFRVVTVQRHSHVAHPDGVVLDCHGLARRRTVHRAASSVSSEPKLANDLGVNVLFCRVAAGGCWFVDR